MAQSETFLRHHRSGSSPPMGPTRLPPGPVHPSKSTSPALHTRSGFNSPRVVEHYSPLSASPRSASLHKESSFETHSSGMARDARGHSDTSLPYASSVYSHPPSHSTSTTPPSAAYGSHYQAPIDLPSRRSMREMPHIPSLTHEDTTLSSDSGGQGGYAPGYQPPVPLVMDVSKSMRVLPAPVPTMTPTTSPLDRPSLVAAVPSQYPDYRSSSSLAALLRAGELARVADADDEDMDKEGSP